MLSFEQEQSIAAHFHQENLDILRTQVGLSEHAAAGLYAKHYQPKAPLHASGDVSDVEVLYRSVGALLDVLMRQHQKRQTILRPPYWKVPWRVAKRLAGG